MIFAAFTISLIAHAHCRAEMCPADERHSDLADVASESADPLCGTELICPAKESTLRAATLTTSAPQTAYQFVPALSLSGNSDRVPNVAALSNNVTKPPLFELHQVFRI
jgi:hypothetical protein